MSTLTVEPCAIERTVEQPGLPARRPETTLTPMMEMIATAAASGNLELVKELYAFHRQVEEDDAKKAFVRAMAAFKSESIRVVLDRENKQYNSRYTSLPNLVNTVTPFLSKHGLSADWDIDQKDGLTVTCVITHELGHSKRVPMKVPPDTSGAKNPIQQIKSAITYAKVCTFESACGLASGESSLDDDGRGAGSDGQQMPDEEFVARRDAIEGAGDEEELKRLYLAAAKAAEAIGDKQTVKAFADAKNKRWREIKGGAR